MLFRRAKEELYEDIKRLILSNADDIKLNHEKESSKLYESISENLSEQLMIRQNECYVNLSTEIARQLQEIQNHLYANISGEIERQLGILCENMDFTSKTLGISSQIKNVSEQIDLNTNLMYKSVSGELERQLVYRIELLKQELEFGKEEKKFFYKILEQFYLKDDLSYFQLMNIYESLQDRQSQDLFMALLNVSLSKSYKRLFEYILNFSPKNLKSNDLVQVIRHNMQHKKR